MPEELQADEPIVVGEKPLQLVSDEVMKLMSNVTTRHLKSEPLTEEQTRRIREYCKKLKPVAFLCKLIPPEPRITDGVKVSQPHALKMECDCWDCKHRRQLGLEFSKHLAQQFMALPSTPCSTGSDT